MKKVLLSSFVLLILVVHVYAAPLQSLYIPHYIIHVHINQDGTVQVEERITKRFDGVHNGVFRDLNAAGVGNITDISVAEYMGDGYIYFPLVQNASIGDDGIFTTTWERLNLRIQVFRPSASQYRTIVYRYTLTQGASRFLDGGVFHRELIGTGWGTQIDRFEAIVTFEEPATAGQFTYELYGYINVLAHSGNADVRVGMYDIPAGQFQAIRVVFPNEWLLSAPLIERYMGDVSSGLFALWLVLGILVGIFVVIIAVLAYLSWPHKVDFDGKYFRELPADNGPAIMAYLVNARAVHTRDLVATLFNLARKGVLAITEEDSGYTFTLMEYNKPLRRHEIYLVKWLIGRIGNGERVSLSSISKTGENKETAILFHQDYTKWLRHVQKDAEAFGYFESYFRRTPEGELEYRKWLALRRYLRHFTREQDVLHESWNNILPYAMSLGLAKKVALVLPEQIEINEDCMLWMMLFSTQLVNACTAAINTPYSNGASYMDDSSTGSSSVNISSSAGSGGGGGSF